MAAYDTDNIFAKILRGELPCHEVFQDDMTLAFMDIMPRVPGHTLVIPRAPSRNILDIAPADIAAVMATVQKIARAQMTAFAADGITIQQFSETAGGQIVFHTHVHVMPRHEGMRLGPPASEMADTAVLVENAEKLRAALAG